MQLPKMSLSFCVLASSFYWAPTFLRTYFLQEFSEAWVSRTFLQRRFVHASVRCHWPWKGGEVLCLCFFKPCE